MTNTDTETQSPVEASNAAAALPGASTPAGGALAASGTQDAASTAAPVAAASQPYATMTTPTAVGVPNPQARPALLGQGGRTKDDYAGDDEVVQPTEVPTGIAAIEYDIRDRTSAKGMTPEAVAQLNAAAEYGGQAGLARIVVVSGRGPGHRSHGHGTEWDLMGYNADGSKWTREQRVVVAQGARSAGATRFGFYEYGKSFPTADGRLHIGSRGPSATWGAGGLVRGDASRRYTNAAEAAFRDAFYGGKDFDIAAYITAKPTMTAEAQNAPGTIAYAGDPFGVSASKAGAKPVPTQALAFTEAQPEAADPTRQVLSTNVLAAAITDNEQIIERGSRGEAVREWQTFLAMHGFTDARGRQIAADGDFGPRTREATKAFQEWASIGIDGRVGPETLRAMLYTLDPSAGPASDGQVAYEEGRKSAAAIVAPTEVDIRLPPLRPERGAGIPNPRLRPKPEDLTEEEIDELTRVDEAGNYIAAPGRRLPTEGLVSEPGKMTETRRAEAYANLEWASRMRAAQAAAAAATRQRIEDRRFVPDKFRPVAKDSRAQSDIMLIRSTEAVREFARGLGDTYRRVTARQQTAVPGGALSAEESRALIDIAMRSDPTPAETVTETYGFWPAGNPIDVETGKRSAARRRELATRELQRGLGKLPSSTTPPTGNVNY